MKVSLKILDWLFCFVFLVFKLLAASYIPKIQKLGQRTALNPRLPSKGEVGNCLNCEPFIVLN